MSRSEVRVREAVPTERPAVANVLDGAALAVDLRPAVIERGAVLVAVAGGSDRILGALVLHGPEIVAVAVRRRRRGQGIGTALVEAAADRRERLVAAFDARVRPFWEELDFDIRAGDEPGRHRGSRPR